MDNNGVELLITGFGIVISLGVLILYIYKTVSANMRLRFIETQRLLDTHEVKLDKHLTLIYEQLRTINSRVGKAEVNIQNNKEDIKENREAISNIREDPRFGRGSV